jgi:hypothetical protein
MKLWEKLDKSDIVVQTANSSFQFPWRGDKFLMFVFMDRGHSREALIRLNWVRLNLQIIFLSNILLALGLRIDPTVLQHWDPSTIYSTKKWPKEEPMESDFELWREAVEDIYPSWLRIHSVGEFIAETHRIHAWQWCLDSNNLHSVTSSATIDVYSNTARKLNRYTKNIDMPTGGKGGNLISHQNPAWGIPYNIHGAQSPYCSNSKLLPCGVAQMGLHMAMGTLGGRRRNGVDLRSNPGWVSCSGH